MLKLKNKSLPGWKSHLELVPENRLELLKHQIKHKKKDASVSLCFFPDSEQNTRLPLILRNNYNGVHSNQISFPGGKKDNRDVNLINTAIRETNEEIGADIRDFNLLGELEPVMTLGTGWAIQPFVGEISKNPSLKKNDEEVEEIVKIPLFKLIEESNKRYVSFTRDENRIDSRAFAFEDKLIWGASARMIMQISDLLNKKVKNG